MPPYDHSTSFNYASDKPNLAYLTMIKDDFHFSRVEAAVVAEWPAELQQYVLYQHTDKGGTFIRTLVLPEGGVVLAHLYNQNLQAELSHASEADLNHLRKTFLGYFDILEQGDESQVEVCFWNMGQHGPSSHERVITVPTWDEISDNYDTQTTELLGRMCEMQTWDPTAGKLVLWRGRPGLGKTFALRALIREWQDWCEFEYIADPEVFFGQSAQYLLKVLLNQSTEWVDSLGESKPVVSQKWRLIILEDAGELLGKDARTETGQALSRLLNTVDGMLGQGLKVILLVTTNEEVGKLHDAVKRPGRCAVNHEFKKLSQDESIQWLENQGHLDKVDKVTGQMTLAELYAVTMDIEVKLGEPLGFAK